MEKDSVQQGSANIREAEGAIAPMSGGVATMGETSGSNVQGAREEQRAVSGSQASDSGTSTIDPLPVGHTIQERTSSPASQRPAEEVSAEIVGHGIQSSEVGGASPSNTSFTHQGEHPTSNDSNNGSASTEHTVVQIAAPSVDQARNSSTPPMVVPIVNILPSTPSQNSMAETSAWGQRSRSSSPFAHGPPSSVPMPAPQPIQPIYYAAPTPMYTTDASGAPIPFTASPAGTPPPVQYVVMPSASPPGSPGPYVQMINGQAMLVQPLPSPVMMPQPAPSSPPAVATAHSQLQTVARPSNQPSQSRRSSDEVPPEVPPKPPALSRASTSATPHLYLPTPINHTITTHLNTPVPLQQPSSSDNIPTTTNLEMPGAFPDQPSGLPLHTPSRRQPRRLSWDESVYDPPPSAQGRRTVASPLNSPILNIPPLTGIGSGAYPPFSPMDDGRGGVGGGGNGGRDRDRDGYFPAYTNGNGNGNGRTDVRVPRRAYSQSSNGRQAISLNDPGPSNLERLPPSRVNSATYGRRPGSGVDFSQVPVGVRDDTTSVTVGSTGEGVTRGLSFMALFPWMRRSRSEAKRQTSDMVDRLSNDPREKTIGERLKPTLDAAEAELKKAKVHAKATGWSLNIAIGAQVVLGALTTGVAAATTGQHTAIATTVLGGLSTLAASYLAKTRSSNEPEASAIRCQSLKEFVRDLQYLRLDRGHLTGHDWEVDSFRRRFEDIMKNNQGGLKVMGEFMKEKVREHVTERVREHVGNDVPVSWSEAKEQAYKQADQVHQQELEQWRRKGGAPGSGPGPNAAGGSKDVAGREETHEKPEVRRQSTQHG